MAFDFFFVRERLVCITSKSTVAVTGTTRAGRKLCMLRTRDVLRVRIGGLGRARPGRKGEGVVEAEQRRGRG